MIPTPSGRSRSGLRRYRLATVLEEIMGTPDKAIPNSVLAKAEGIAVFPPTVKGGFIFGAHRGQTRGQILVTSVLEGDGALWRLCPGDPRLSHNGTTGSNSQRVGYVASWSTAQRRATCERSRS